MVILLWQPKLTNTEVIFSIVTLWEDRLTNILDTILAKQGIPHGTNLGGVPQGKPNILICGLKASDLGGEFW